MSGTIAVDLDGTLAHWDGVWGTPDRIGLPVPLMLERVKKWLAEGRNVVIFTARAEVPECIPPVEAWCVKHLGVKLKVTNHKTLDIVEIWDDRAISVKMNTGRAIRASDVF